MTHMRIVCDADGLIKMQQADLLDLLVHHAEVYIGPEVFREAVTDGKARGYPDVVALGQLLQPHWPQPAPPTHPHAVQMLQGTRLGPGETEALQLYFHAQYEAILSDDRAFVTLLLTHQFPVLTPAAVVVALCEWGLWMSWRAITPHVASCALYCVCSSWPEREQPDRLSTTG